MRLLLPYTLGLCLVLSSCMNSFRISVQEPANIKLPEAVTVIGVINNIQSENTAGTVIDNVLSGQQFDGNQVAAERAVNGIINALNDSRNMHGEEVLAENNQNADGSLNWTKLDTMAAAGNMHAYIEITEVRTVSPIGGTVVANATGQRSNRLDGTLIMNIHIVGTGENIQGNEVRRSYNIPTSGSTNVVDILNDVAKKREYYRRLGYNLGYRAGSYVYPNWVWVNRKYYTKGTRAIKNAKNMIRYGNWDIAEETLRMDEDFGKIKKRGRVLFNLALVKEGQGDIDEAIRYAERSAAECGNKDANEYLVKLRRRKRQLQNL